MSHPLGEALEALREIAEHGHEDFEHLGDLMRFARDALTRLNGLPAPSYLSAREIELGIDLVPRAGWFYPDPPERSA